MLIKIDDGLSIPHIRTGTKEFAMSGLDDVIAAETVLSDVDGANGQLIIRGVPVEELARHSTFEAAALLLFAGFFPDLPDEAGFAKRLGRAREAAFARLAPQFP